ncbi:MAG: hypothetical protein Q9220_007559 [cf. Caloplaca sp. 1 TL-2023]
MIYSTLYLTALLGLTTTLTSATPVDVNWWYHASDVDRCWSRPNQTPAPWLDFFDKPNCANREMGRTITLVKDHCIKIDTPSDNMAVGWWKGNNTLHFYEDEHCKKGVAKVVQPKKIPLDCNSCVHLKQDFKGKGVKSVKWTEKK